MFVAQYPARTKVKAEKAEVKLIVNIQSTTMAIVLLVLSICSRFCCLKDYDRSQLSQAVCLRVSNCWHIVGDSSNLFFSREGKLVLLNDI